MNSKQIQADIDFAKSFIFTGETTEYGSSVEKACFELRSIANSRDNVKFELSEEQIEKIKKVALKYQLKVEVLKSIILGTKINATT